jgi:hypothetical protein
MVILGLNNKSYDIVCQTTMKQKRDGMQDGKIVFIAYLCMSKSKEKTVEPAEY